jgi:uncharacterized protein YpmB
MTKLVANFAKITDEMIYIIVFLIVIIVACAVTYKTAEVHELHKMRAAFENRRHDLYNNRTADDDDYFRGEEKGLKDAIDLVDEIEEAEKARIF